MTPALDLNSIAAKSDRLGHESDSRYQYVLITAAYNEESNIEKTIQAVLSQTVLPLRWVIVSDGSYDKTDDIVRAWAREHALIHFLRIRRNPGHSFGSKVRALHTAISALKDINYQFIGNIDADVSVDPQFFEQLMEWCIAHPVLGIAGGFVVEEDRGQYRNRRQNRVYSVAHAAQIVRRECFEAIGGYAVLKYGGEDWHAQISAKMKGWAVRAFSDLKIYHHRHTGEANNLLLHKFRQGRMDYSVGSDPLFEFLKCMLRVLDRPFLIGSVMRFAGFCWALLRREQRPVSNEFIAFLRAEQKTRLRLLRSFRWGSDSS
jgi:poly-beta-1,6-N-acetyl-D-glucosamine synthase